MRRLALVYSNNNINKHTMLFLVKYAKIAFEYFYFYFLVCSFNNIYLYNVELRGICQLKFYLKNRVTENYLYYFN